MLEDSYSNKDTIHMKMHITMEPLQQSPRSNKLFWRSIVTVGWTVPLYVGRGHEASSFIGITLVYPILKDTPRFFEVARLCSKKN